MMVALWLIGVEREPEESGEICVMEIFGRDLQPDRGLVGLGVHAFGDPRLSEDFEKVEVQADLTTPHDYRAEWTPDGVTFSIDGAVVKRTAQSPHYPMQLMLDVFEFDRDPGGRYPKEFVVESVLGWD
jgi:beta-glucanase (GH16 family)